MDSLAIGAAKAAQVFWVQPGRDTLLLGAEGTAIWVPAKVFAHTANGLPVTEAVEFSLKEFYSLPDILLNNLSTNSSGGLLETGGMLHLAARTASGQPCQLQPGTELLLRLPARQPKAGMQLYAGVRQGRRGLDWQRPRPALQANDFDWRGPVLQNERQLRSAVWKQLAPWTNASAAHQLLKAQTRAQRRAMRRRWWPHHRTAFYCQLLATVNQQGQVTNRQVLNCPDTALRVALMQALGTGLQFRPAYQVGPVRRQQRQRSYLDLSAKKLRGRVTPVASLPMAGTWCLNVVLTRRGRVLFPWPSEGFAGTGMNGNSAVIDADDARQELRAAKTGRWQAMGLDSLSGYLFSAAELGWANCDRAGQFTSKRILFGVDTGAPDTQVNLVFRRARAVVSSDNGQGGSLQQYFHSAPIGEPATLVAMRRANGVTYLAIKEVEIHEGLERGLNFQPVTPAELRVALARIEN